MRYKELTPEEKLKCLIKPEDVDKLKTCTTIDQNMFSTTLNRIIRVIKYNYIKDFNSLELMMLNEVHKKKLTKPGLGFNSNGNDLAPSGRQTNIFSFFGKNKPNLSETQATIDQSANVKSKASLSQIDIKSIRKVRDVDIS